MKKILAVILFAVMAMSLTACSSDDSDVPKASPDTSRSHSEKAKTLVVYFSMPDDDIKDSTVTVDGETLGNTQYMAYVIQENTNGNIFRIIPQTDYPTDHDELIDLAKEEKNDNARPKIESTVENFDNYDTVFIGYPNWWGDMPMILYTFFDTYDFSGKTIIPFNTHGGSGFSQTIDTIKGLEPDADVKDGLSVSRDDIEDAQSEIVEWLKGLGFEKNSSQTTE